MYKELMKDQLTTMLTDGQLNLDCSKDVIKIDMHCHDKNSDKPSEPVGRILGVPETWLPTEDLTTCIKNNGATGLTITNHNNARSCWDLLDKGLDILSGAEFTCNLPKSDISIHVLTYGFTPIQEVKLNKIRKNLYDFLTYCSVNQILTVWAHPFYFNHSRFSMEAIAHLEHIATLFTHFEVINGQRNSKQNLVTWKWIKTFDQEKIERISSKFDLNINNIHNNSLDKYFIGGSDDHMGLFAGNTGTYVKIDNLEHRLKTSSKANLILEGLKSGRVTPYGSYVQEEKMSIALFEYLYQIIKYMEDPGLIRVLLHQGKKSEKLLALLFTNGIEELRRHKYTLQFFKYFHRSLHGKGPGFWPQTFVKKTTRPILLELDNIAKSKAEGVESFVKQSKESLNNIFLYLNKQAIQSASDNIKNMALDKSNGKLKLQPLLNKIELSASFRSYVDKETTDVTNLDDDKIDLGKFFDKMSFPALASSIIAGINFTSCKVLNDNRQFLDHFGSEAGIKPEPKRMLWLTDTFKDKNGIAISLNNYLDEVRSQNLAIDFLVCRDDLKSDKNLIVTKPLGTFPIPMYKEQLVNIPNILEIQDIFLKGNYDRIICSTEFLMGVVGLYLKHAFNIKAYFFIHTDWIEFCRTKLELSPGVLNRVTKFSRSFYKGYDKLFVLNNDHKKWLISSKMKIPENKIITTKHWVNPIFNSSKPKKTDIITKNGDEKILLFVGRLSEEKGLVDFSYIVDKIKADFGKCKAVFIGDGPMKETLKNNMPEAIVIDWIEQEKLPDIYKLADFLVFPSRFDTFGRVVLESISCGCPVAAYNEKGPKDIIENMVSGVLAKDKYELADRISEILNSTTLHSRMKKEAVKRSLTFRKQIILDDLLKSTDLK